MLNNYAAQAFLCIMVNSGFVFILHVYVYGLYCLYTEGYLCLVCLSCE